MTIGKHIESFANRPVRLYDPKQRINEPTKYAYKLNLEYDAAEKGGTFVELFNKFLADPQAKLVEALVIGCWEDVCTGTDSSELVSALANAAAGLPHLKALFLGEVTFEESEISWIQQSNVSPLLDAFPQLEEFFVRGGNGLSLSLPRQSPLALKKLVIQSGGLPGSVVREVCAINFPQLEHLELWLGSDNYGNDVTDDDLAPLLSGELFPKLRQLGLCDDEKADATAQLLAKSPLVARLEVLDLSLGNLSDDGLEALLNNPALRKLRKLDLHHHYLSEPMMARVAMLGPEVDLSDQKEPDDDDGEPLRYIAVAE